MALAPPQLALLAAWIAVMIATVRLWAVRLNGVVFGCATPGFVQRRGVCLTRPVSVQLLTNVCMVLCGWGNGLLAPGVLIIALGLDFKFGMSWCGATADWLEARKLAFLLLAIGALLIGLSYVDSACPGKGKAPE